MLQFRVLDPRLAFRFLLPFILPGLCAGLLAQTAEITGRITDPSGGVAPQVNVKVTNIDTGVIRNAKSNDQGYYTISALVPGNYKLHLEHPGFKPVERTGIRLNVDDKARVDFTLQIGNLSDESPAG